MKICLCLFMAAAMLLSSTCLADEPEGEFDRGRPYGRFSLGPIFAPELRGFDFNTGVNVEGALGYRFKLPLRAELAVDYARQSTRGWGSSKAFSRTSYMVNGYVDLPNPTPVTPFAGAGIGWYEIDFKRARASSTGAAANFMGGVYVKVASNAAIYANYKYFRELDESPPYKSHGAMIGVMVSF